MGWIAYSLLAPFFWTGTSFIDKYVLERHSKGIADYLFFSTITSLPLCALLVAFFGMPAFTADAWIPLLTGAALVYSYGFYARALQQGDTSTFVVLYALIPVITLTLAFVLLGQVLSRQEMIGFFVVLFGAVAISFDGKRMRLMKGFGMILAAMFLWSGMSLLTDYGLETIPFWDFVIIDSFGSALAGVTLFFVPSLRKNVVEGIRGASAQKYTWYTVNNLVDFAGLLAIKKAFALAPSVGLVTVVTRVQSAYAILLGLLLTMFFPTIIKEDISAKTLTKKAIGAAIMFIGIYILIM